MTGKPVRDLMADLEASLAYARAMREAREKERRLERRKTCPTCNDAGLIHDPNATTEGQWNEGTPCPECDGMGLA